MTDRKEIKRGRVRMRERERERERQRERERERERETERQRESQTPAKVCAVNIKVRKMSCPDGGLIHGLRISTPPAMGSIPIRANSFSQFQFHCHSGCL